MRSVIVVPAALMVTVACSNAASRPQGDLDRRGSFAEEFRIDGSVEDLVAIGAVAVSGAGTVAMTQAQLGQIRFYTPEGELHGVFGSRGEGPGEFLNPFRIGWHADTLWAYDGRLRRITHISSNLTAISTISNLPNAVQPAGADVGRVPQFPFATLLALGRDGGLYASFGLAANQIVPEPFRDRTTIGRMTLDGTIDAVILSMPPSEHAGVTSPDGGSATLPFPNAPRYGISTSAERVVIAMASLEGADAGTYSLTATDLQGDTAFSVRLPFPTEPIPTAVADSTLQAWIERLQSASPSLADAVRRDGSFPPLYPPLMSLCLGADGSAWIELRETDEGVPHHVVDAEGIPIGTLVLPPRSRILAATMDRIWVVEANELDVPSLVQYAVSWSAQARS